MVEGGGLLSVVMTVMTALGLIGLIAARRQRDGDWNLTSRFIFWLGWAVNSAALIAALTGRYVVQFEPTIGANVRNLTDANTTLFRYIILATTFGAAIVTLIGLSHEGRKVNAPALLALALCFFMNISNAASLLPVGRIGFFCMLAVFAATAFLVPGRGAWLGAALFTVSLSTASAAITVWKPDVGARECTLDKCGPLHVLILGTTASENALALALALGLPFVILAFQGRTRWLLTSHTVAMIVLTGSRTALFAVAATLVLAFLLRPGRAKAQTGWIAGLGLVAVTIVSFYVPRASQINNTSFSTRGYLWQYALWVMPDERWFGFGSASWSTLRTNAGVINAGAIYSPHNQWLDVQYAAGYVGLLVFLAWLLAVLYSSRDNIRLIGFVIVPALVVGITERPWSFGLPDWLTWALVATMLAAPRLTEESPRTSDADSPPRSRSSPTRAGRFVR